jgi:hypothetical protein
MAVIRIGGAQFGASRGYTHRMKIGAVVALVMLVACSTTDHAVDDCPSLGVVRCTCPNGTASTRRCVDDTILLCGCSDRALNDGEGTACSSSDGCFTGCCAGGVDGGSGVCSPIAECLKP